MSAKLMPKFSRLEIPHINSPVGTPRRYMLPIGTPGALQQIFLEIMGGAHQALMHARLSLTKRLNVPDHARVVHSIRKNVASVLDRLGNRCDHVRVADQAQIQLHLLQVDASDCIIDTAKEYFGPRVAHCSHLTPNVEVVGVFADPCVPQLHC